MMTDNQINVTTDLDKVILVNENDEERGTMDKLEAHRKGLLHRAFSVFVFNSKNELMLHQRASDKYHCSGLWTNTCCSHPRPGEEVADAAHRRLKEEMGFDCNLDFAFQFVYKSKLDNDLTEHELDHVYLGIYDQLPEPNAGEVENWKFMSIDEIRHSLKSTPEVFTPWFKKVFERVLDFKNEREPLKNRK